MRPDALCQTTKQVFALNQRINETVGDADAKAEKIAAIEMALAEITETVAKRDAELTELKNQASYMQRHKCCNMPP